MVTCVISVGGSVSGVERASCSESSVPAGDASEPSLKEFSEATSACGSRSVHVPESVLRVAPVSSARGGIHARVRNWATCRSGADNRAEEQV